MTLEKPEWGKETPHFLDQLELGEIISDTQARWFAGAFEAGGTACFRTTNRINKNGSPYSYACPQITLRDTNAEFINHIYSQYGGTFRTRGQSHEWTLSSKKAAYILASMKPYIVTRKEIVTAVERWLQADTAEGVEIAKEMLGYNRYQPVQVEDYRRLVSDPDFVAGVIDNRGMITKTGDSTPGSAYPKILIHGANKPLLDALAKKFNGQVDQIVEENQEVNIQGKKGKTHKKSYQLVIQYENARELLRLVENHIHLPLTPNWDRLVSTEIQAAQNLRNVEIVKQITDELETFRRGERNTLTGNSELAGKFSISLTQLSRILHLLPDDIRRERARIIKQLISRHESNELDQKILASLQEEWEKHVKGVSVRLRSNQDLILEFGVKIDYLLRHVLPLLDQQLRKKRATALRSQWTRENDPHGWSSNRSSGVLFP